MNCIAWSEGVAFHETFMICNICQFSLYLKCFLYDAARKEILLDCSQLRSCLCALGKGEGCKKWFIFLPYQAIKHAWTSSGLRHMKEINNVKNIMFLFNDARSTPDSSQRRNLTIFLRHLIALRLYLRPALAVYTNPLFNFWVWFFCCAVLFFLPTVGFSLLYHTQLIW